ncbi:MAG: ABC transporter ATP-binding protein, partial [Lachnospiraceae bacterium]|nr:ABC transporter ATP-binding protein [Lachnospiraceae bacterium]
VGDREINEFYKNDKLQFRRNVQMVFQNPFDTFDPRYTIKKILMEVLDIHHIGNTKEEKMEIITKGLESVELKPAEDYMDRRPHELSGGQLQRVSILRAMLLKPKVLISDEPVSMLDVSVRADVIKMLQNLARENGTTLLFISHDINTVRYISDRVIVMYLGRIVEEGITDEVLHNPQHPYTKALISNCSSIDVFEKKEKIKVDGEPPSPIDNGPGCYFAPRCPFAAGKCAQTYPDMQKISDTHKASCHLLNEKEDEQEIKN